MNLRWRVRRKAALYSGFKSSKSMKYSPTVILLVLIPKGARAPITLARFLAWIRDPK
jgi:hypothetical protein